MKCTAAIMSALLLVHATTAALSEQPETRIAGVGIGIVLVAVFACLGVLVCCVGITTPRPGCFACIGTAIFVIVLLFLMVAQKTPRYIVVDTADTIQHYDSTFYPRVIIFIMVLASWLIGLVAICYTHLGTPLYARPAYDLASDCRPEPLF